MTLIVLLLWLAGTLGPAALVAWLLLRPEGTRRPVENRVVIELTLRARP